MRKIFVITILGFAILSHAQSNYPKNSKEKKNNVKNVQSESIHEYQQPYKNISSTKLYSDNLVILRKRNSDSLAMDRKRSAQENLKNNQDTQLFFMIELRIKAIFCNSTTLKTNLLEKL